MRRLIPLITQVNVLIITIFFTDEETGAERTVKHLSLMAADVRVQILGSAAGSGACVLVCHPAHLLVVS